MGPRILCALPPPGGGAAVFLEVAAGLARRGVPVEALVPLSSRAHELDAGVRLRYYEVPPLGACIDEIETFASLLPWAHAAYRELRALEPDFDIVFAHVPWGMTSFYAHDRRRPLVGFIDVQWSDMFDGRGRAPLDPMRVQALLQRQLDLRALRACDRLVAPSAFYRDLYAGRGLRVDVIRHGRDPARFRAGRDRARARARLGLEPHATTVLAVGFDFNRKGHPIFAELALRMRDPDVRFVAVGPTREAFAAWFARDETLGRRLIVRSGVPHQEVAEYFACADIFVFPTSFESFGLAAIEALASGTPVVAHRAASMPELIEDGVEGWLVPPGDLDAMEARVRDLLRDSERRRAMGEAARARFLRDFTEDRMLDEYVAYFEGLRL